MRGGWEALRGWDDKNRMVARVVKPALPAVTITAWRNLRDFLSWRGIPLTVHGHGRRRRIVLRLSTPSDDSPREESEYSVGCGKR